MTAIAWHVLSAEEAARRERTDLALGLSAEEAARRADEKAVRLRRARR